MKNMNSQSTSDSVMVAKKLKNASAGSESNTKGSLQDGGTQQNMSGDRSGNESVRGMEGPHNSDLSYPPNSGGQNNSGDNYDKMNDGMSGPQMSNFSSGYMRGSYNMTDQQHGGMGNPSTGSDFPQQNSHYNHPFVQQNMRGANYPTGNSMPRGSPMANRPGVGGNSMGMIQPGYNPNQQQRPFMSGPSIQQQGGSTPTLNQLLQNPNPSARYQSGYGDYGMNQQKTGPENMNNSQSYGSQGWNQQRPVSPYQSQMHGGSQPFRNQGPMFDGNRRHMPAASGYPQQGPGQYPSQNQFSPSSPQRYPGAQTRMPGQPFPQQMSGASYGQQHSSQHQGGQSFGPQQATQNHHHHPQAQTGLSPSQQSPGAGHHTRSTYHTPPSSQQSHSHSMHQPGQQQQQQPTSSSSSSTQQRHSPSPSPGTQSGHPNTTGIDKHRGGDDITVAAVTSTRHGKGSSDSGDSPSSQPATSTNQHLLTNTSQDSVSGTGSSDDLNSDTNSTGTNSRPTPTPTPTSTPGPHSGAPLRPVPSPAGSTGSRSNTPASVTAGNSAGSPMPPRPPSNQIDGQQGRIQSPMANQQGYPGQGPTMMPPPMGPNQMMYPGSNKIASSMMGANPMPNFNSQYPNHGQGNYRGLPNMAGYGNQPASFNGPSMSMASPYSNYGNSNMGQPGMNRSMSQYNNQYPPSSSNTINNTSYNSHFGNYGPQTTLASSSSQSTPQPPATSQSTQGSSSGASTSPQPSGAPSPCPKGAQAAAHAAMLAAANQSAVKPPYSSSGRSRSPSGNNSSSQPLTPPGPNQSAPGQVAEQPPPPSQKGQPNQHPPIQSPQGLSQPPHQGQGPQPGPTSQSGPAHPAGGPTHQAGGPHPAGGPSHPAGGPHQAGGPHPAGPSHPGGGPTHQAGGPHPAGGPSHPAGGPHQSSQPLHQPGLPPSESGPPSHPQAPGHSAHHSSSGQHPHPGQSGPQQHSGPQPHPGMSSHPLHPGMPQPHAGQPPHHPHPGMPHHPSGPPQHLQSHANMPGTTSGPHHSSHQRMYPPGHYPQADLMNHVNYNNAMNQMNNQMPPSNSGENSMPHYNNSVDSMGPGSGPASYGHMGASGAGPAGMGPMSSRHPGPSDMTNTHGMSGGCVSVSPNLRPPNSLPPNSMPVNSTSMCDMNNGIPPNAMAPPAGSMGHGNMRGPNFQGPDGVPIHNNMGMPQMPPGTREGRPPTSSSGTSQGDDTSDVDCKPAISLASTIAGDSSTSVTQSINTPLTNALETKPTMSLPGSRLMGPPPPRTTLTPSQIDSSSQDSHSSSQDSDTEKSRIKMDKLDNLSHPPTPASQVAPSPATSIHDELENISSPSWPGTPKPEKSEKAERTPFNDVFGKQLEFGGEPDRRGFLERLFMFMTDKACPITAMPMISKQPIDLYKLYHLVKEKGGMVDVTKNKKWRDVSGALNIGASSSAGFTLRKNYAKFIFPLECKFDRGDADPGPILASLETPSKKESKKSQQAAATSSQPMQDPFRGGQQAPFGNFGGNMRHPQMGNTDMHGPMMPPNVSMMPNNMHYDQGGIIPNSNMMPNSMMPNNTMGMGPNAMGGNGMMPGHAMGNPNMMSNQNMPSGGMGNTMGPSAVMSQVPNRNMVPSSGDSLSAQNPFADSPSPMTPQYQRTGVPPNMPPYSANMQQQQQQQQQGSGPSNSFPNFGNRSSSMPGYPNNLSHSGPPTYPDGNRINSTSSNSTDSFGSGDNYSSHHSTSSAPYSQGASGQGSFSNQPFANRSSAGSSGPQPFNQQQQQQQTPSPAPVLPTSASQPTPPAPATQNEPNVPVEGNSRPMSTQPKSEPAHPTPPPVLVKPNPPQLHSTDSNSSTGSQGLRPPSQPGPVSSQDQPTPTPHSQMYPGPYNNQQPPTSQTEPFNQQSSSQPQQIGMMPPSSSHGNQMAQGPFSGVNQHSQSYPQGARPYPQGPHEPGYQGYHGQPGPGSSTYPMTKAPHGSQYGPGHQPYTPNKVYPDHRREGYIMPPEMMPGRDVAQSPQRHPSSTMAYAPSMPQTPQMYKRPHMAPHSPMHGTHQMSPQRPDRRGYSMSSSAKLQKGAAPMHRPGALETKKEIVFPPGSVETTRAHLLKRKKLKHKDIGTTEPWRLMMALRSGLLVESTWALDTLSVLLYDDNTVAWFGLQHLPGLIEILLEHFRRCLVKIFDSDFDEMEIGSERKKELQVARQDESLYELLDDEDEMELPQCTPQPGRDGNGPSIEGDGDEEDDRDNEEDAKSEPIEKEPVKVKNPPCEVVKKRVWKICKTVPDPEKLKEPRNFTLKTRDGKVVKVEDNSPDEWMLMKKHWDIYDDFDSSTFDWQLGRGDATNHILTHMESENAADFFRKCFFKKQASKEQKGSDTCNILKDLKEESDCVNDSSPVIPEEDKFDASSPMPTLPHVGSSPKCDVDRSPCADCIDNPASDSKLSVPAIKTEPVDCSPESGVVVKTEQDMDVDDLIKQEPCDSTKSKSPSVSVKDDDASEVTSSDNPEPTDEDDLTFISTSRQLNDLKRKWTETELEGESYQRDDLPFMLLPEALEEVSKRCVCVSNIFRSLSFIPGNDLELSRHPGLMLVLGRLLLLHHTHPTRNPEHHKFDREVEMEAGDTVEDSKREWWWDTLDALRENTLVTIANISGQVNLITYPEEICLPILDGLLHWAVCPSAYAQDPMPTMSSNSVLSPQRLVLEALCKLCIIDSNVDLVLATPPFNRVVQLLGNLVQLISNQGDQVMREFGIVLLSSLVQGEVSAARAVALHHPSVSLLLNFIETAETQALNIANTHAHGISLLQENPEMMGTSLDMLRRTASVLRAISDVPENRNLFQHHQHRLLHLVMSQILDHRVASILSDVLFNCAEHS